MSIMTSRKNDDDIPSSFDESSWILSEKQQTRYDDHEKSNTFNQKCHRHHEEDCNEYHYKTMIRILFGFCFVICSLFVYLGQSILYELRQGRSNNHMNSLRRDTEEILKPLNRPHEYATALKILIVYLDGHKHQLAMAREIRRGVLSTSNDIVDAKVMTTANATFQDVLESDGIIIGSPVYNANIHPELQKWINTEWDIENANQMRWKVGGVFVTAGGISAGEEGTMFSLIRNLQVFQMIVVGGESWTTAFGASAILYEPPFGSSQDDHHDYFQSNCYSHNSDLIHPMFLRKAYGLGQRVSHVSFALKRGR